MINREFYRKLNREASTLQTLAYKLTRDMEPARQLYLETIFQAEKNSIHFKREKSFKAWIIAIMKAVFQNGN